MCPATVETVSAARRAQAIGFAIWDHRDGGGRNVTFPAHQYAVNGERRCFAHLRQIADNDASRRIRELVLEAYAEFEARIARTA